MVDEEKITPEEKLLKAVEQGFSPKEEPSGAGEEKKTTQTESPSGPKDLKTKWIDFLEMKIHELRERKILPSFISKLSFSQWHLDLRFVNFFLAGAALLVVIIILIDLVFFQPKMHLQVSAAGPAALPDFLVVRDQPKELPHYVNLAENRNLFQPYIPKPVVTPGEKQKVEEIKAMRESAPPNLKLVAVASTETGFEAIIEDEAKKESYFVKKGEHFADYDVESVDWNKVVITQDSSRWELQ